MVGWMKDWLDGWMAGRLDGWTVGWWRGWLAKWLKGWGGWAWVGHAFGVVKCVSVATSGFSICLSAPRIA